jgi:hypothetical protein
MPVKIWRGTQEFQDIPVLANWLQMLTNFLKENFQENIILPADLGRKLISYHLLHSNILVALIMNY